jgi:hypothetical protein
LANVDIITREVPMIPSSHFVHVIQAERERDLERWQRTRAADIGQRRRPRASLGDRLRTALRQGDLSRRPDAARLPGTVPDAGLAACC